MHRFLFAGLTSIALTISAAQAEPGWGDHGIERKPSVSVVALKSPEAKKPLRCWNYHDVRKPRVISLRDVPKGWNSFWTLPAYGTVLVTTGNQNMVAAEMWTGRVAKSLTSLPFIPCHMIVYWKPIPTSLRQWRPAASLPRQVGRPVLVRLRGTTPLDVAVIGERGTLRSEDRARRYSRRDVTHWLPIDPLPCRSRSLPCPYKSWSRVVK